MAGTVQAFVHERLGMFFEQNPPIAKRIGTLLRRRQNPSRIRVGDADFSSMWNGFVDE